MPSTTYSIILDTNVLQYALNKDYAESLAKLLEQFKNKNFKVVISEYTVFETFNGLSKKKVLATGEILKSFNKLKVDLSTLQIAAALSTCYRTHDATKKYCERYTPGDLIIGASAFRYGGTIDTYLLTGNRNDFPSPFFKERQRYELEREDGKKLVLYTIEPCTDILNQSIETTWK